MKIKLTILFLILVLITTTGLSCGGGDKQAEEAIVKSIELTIWGLFDASDVFDEIIAAYRLLRPNVKIKYQKLRWEEYQDELLKSWAEGSGPDIFVVHNTWVDEYQSKILPIPTKIQLPVYEQSGLLKQNKKAVIKDFSMITADQLKNIFPDVVYSDMVRDNLIYGLPLSVDTLALFYNRDHLNAAGLTSPPTTWQELIQVAPQLTLQDESGDFLRSAIALGGADNINRSNDILFLLMLQNGTSMTNARGNITFDEASTYDNKFFPGEQALKFYTDFALPSKEVYTWHADLAEAVELFSAGKLSLLFGFSYQTPIIKAQAPRINFSIAPAPHINADGTDSFGLPVNLASYWSYSVFKRTKYPNEAWDFINFMTLENYKDENGKTAYYAESYLNATQKPPALKNLINKYKTLSPELTPFVEQILTAQNWYHGKNSENMNSVFKNMIKNVIQGKLSVADALKSAARAISESY